MTPKAEALLDAVLVPYEVYGFEEALKPLVAYIEELERKAAYHDALMAMQTEERTDEASGDSQWCSAHRD